MASQDMARATAPLASCQGIEQRFDGTTGNAKHEFDADLLQVGDEQVGDFRVPRRFAASVVRRTDWD